MKKIHLLICTLLMSVLPLGAVSDGAEFIYTNADELPLFGKITPDTYHRYSRFPESMEKTTGKAVWDLSRHSAGLFLRFRTDAGQLKARWTVYGKGCGDNMNKILKMGMSLYAFDRGKWVFVGVFRPGSDNPGTPREFTVKFSKLKGTMTEFMVYLPMYDELKDLEFGVPEGASILLPELVSPSPERPVIAYGTSILQGASASHPGLAGTSLLSRMLDRVVVNMGFSGSAKIEPEVAEYLASCPDPGAFILDNAPNCTASMIREKQEAFYRILRNAHPDVPVIFVEQPVYPCVRFDKEGAADICGRRDAMDEVFFKLKKAGEKNIYLVRSGKMLREDNTGTIEGTHFTDSAFERWADELYRILKRF